MDEAGIDMQVISLYQPPHIQRLEAADAKKWAVSTNDQLSTAVQKYPKKFIGLAAIPAQSPRDAVEELERAVTKLGLKGVCLVSNANEEYLDNKKYWGIFETAEKLNAPIYLHPVNPPSTAITSAYNDYPQLAGPPHGYYAEVSLHVMRLIYSGLFDKYPGLKIILGHMGEGLPFWFPRIDIAWLRGNPMGRPSIQKKPSEYLKSNFTITTSGMFFQPALICSYMALGADNIAFAVDYPPERNDLAVTFIKAASICDSDKEKICHSNAEALFGL
jgi:predicted TIM-barrel fold metal-dependent hydrolase